MWHVAIPTYHRVATLNKRTLPALLDRGVPADRITVFAGDREDYRLPAGVQLERVPAGLQHASNAITDYYPEDAEIVRCDDDMLGVVRLNDEGKMRYVEDLGPLFDAAFARLFAEHLTLWGVGPVAGPAFLLPRWEPGLWFCIGTVFGVRNRRKIRSTLPVKNDYERTLQHWQHAGAVLRLRDTSFRAEPMRSARGGLQSDLNERRTAEVLAVASLIDRWPAVIRAKANRDGYPEIALRLPKR